MFQIGKYTQRARLTMTLETAGSSEGVLGGEEEAVTKAVKMPWVYRVSGAFVRSTPVFFSSRKIPVAFTSSSGSNSTVSSRWEKLILWRPYLQHTHTQLHLRLHSRNHFEHKHTQTYTHFASCSYVLRSPYTHRVTLGLGRCKFIFFL